MDAIRQLGAIAFTLAMLAAALWYARRRGFAALRRGRPGKLMEVIESRTLAPGHTLHLVRLADRALALETHHGGCTLLETRPWGELRQSMAAEARS